jgi:hypothetical protein
MTTAERRASEQVEPEEADFPSQPQGDVAVCDLSGRRISSRGQGEFLQRCRFRCVPVFCAEAGKVSDEVIQIWKPQIRAQPTRGRRV